MPLGRYCEDWAQFRIGVDSIRTMALSIQQEFLTERRQKGEHTVRVCPPLPLLRRHFTANIVLDCPVSRNGPCPLLRIEKRDLRRQAFVPPVGLGVHDGINVIEEDGLRTAKEDGRRW
jgi:hypothetical protein